MAGECLCLCKNASAHKQRFFALPACTVQCTTVHSTKTELYEDMSLEYSIEAKQHRQLAEMSSLHLMWEAQYRRKVERERIDSSAFQIGATYCSRSGNILLARGISTCPHGC
jgi:hypothetical protein